MQIGRPNTNQSKTNQLGQVLHIHKANENKERKKWQLQSKKLQEN